MACTKGDQACADGGAHTSVMEDSLSPTNGRKVTRSLETTATRWEKLKMRVAPAGRRRSGASRPMIRFPFLEIMSSRQLRLPLRME